MTLKEFVYYKNLPEPMHSDLIAISMSSHWLEDLIDYIAGFDKKIEDAEEALKLLQKDLGWVQEVEVRSLSEQLGDALKAKEEVLKARKFATVGGIEVKVDA